MLKRIYGLYLIVTAVLPLVLVVAIFVIVQQIMSDVGRVLDAPVATLTSGLNEVSGTVAYMGTQVREVAMQATRIAATYIAPVGTQIANLPTDLTIPTVVPPTVPIPAPTLMVTYATYMPPSISYPVNVQLRADALRVTEATIVPPSITYPSGVSFSANPLTVSYSSFGLSGGGFDFGSISYPSGVSLSSSALQVAVATLTLPTIRYPRSMALSSDPLTITFATLQPPPLTYPVNVRFSSTTFNLQLPSLGGRFTIPGMVEARTLLGRVINLANELGANLVRLSGLQSAFEAVDRAAQSGRAIADGVRQIGAAWSAMLTFIGVVLAILLAALSVETLLRRLSRGWRLLTGAGGT